MAWSEQELEILESYEPEAAAEIRRLYGIIARNNVRHEALQERAREMMRWLKWWREQGTKTDSERMVDDFMRRLGRGGLF